MKEIQLTRGYIAIVDDEDFELASRYKWRACPSTSHGVYAISRWVIDGREYTIGMHRLVMGCRRGDGKIIDHKNGNGLDNRKENLRFCTATENARNAKKSNKVRSRYKGAYYHQAERVWRAQIKVGGKLKQLGRFQTEREAAIAYNDAARMLHGEFASLNEI